MSLLAFLWALFTQMPAGLEGNAWGVKALQLTLANLHSMQFVFGWITLGLIILIVIILAASILFGGKGFGEALSAAGCFGTVAFGSFILWLVGFLHILAVGYLVANFTLAGAANPGFWIVLVILILCSWS